MPVARNEALKSRRNAHRLSQSASVVAITSGLMILSTDPTRYVAHPTMRLKLFLLLVAIAFNYTIHARVVRGGYSLAVGRSVAMVSLMLWVSTVFSGVFYAFT